MNQRFIASLTHVLGIFTLFLGPLVVYFVFRKRADPWLRDHLDESVNYNILATVAFLVLIVVAILMGSSAFALWVALLAIHIVAAKILLEVIATVKAAGGKPFHFPLDIKMIK